ncbi:hypothetical protein [Rhizobium sp. NFR12]|uniref:hypothetical protein n=1 Tax=Rhizobium sp. NFR12 TaxID=1566261 RepID=UPI0008A7B38F|nr:hypothetical protein [Rhizobium sp. NFR12]SEH22528.1 hypothetical protein SAMN03159407_1171 [Rhizobium sp. NFR12]
MFKLSSELTFPWPVKVIEPNPGSPGELIEREFEVIFAILDPEVGRKRTAERRAILAKMTPGMELDELKVIQEEIHAHDQTALQEVIRGWSSIVGDDDKPIAFTDVTFRAVTAHERVRIGLVRAYEEAISQDKARLGN